MTLTAKEKVKGLREVYDAVTKQLNKGIKASHLERVFQAGTTSSQRT